MLLRTLLVTTAAAVLAACVLPVGGAMAACEVTAPCCSTTRPDCTGSARCLCWFICPDGEGNGPSACYCDCVGSLPRDPFTPLSPFPKTLPGLNLHINGTSATDAAHLGRAIQDLFDWDVDIPTAMLDDAVATGQYGGSLEDILDEIGDDNDLVIVVNSSTSTVDFSYP